MAQSFLHNLPHLNHSLNTVSNEIIIPDTIHHIFIFNTNSYLQSIQMFAFIPILFGIIYAIICIIILSAYCLSGMCRNMFSYGKASHAKDDDSYQPLTLLFHKHNSYSDEYDIELTRFSKTIRIIFAWFVPVTLVICTIYGTSFNQSLIHISDDWSSSYNNYQLMIHDTHQIYEYYIPSAQLQCESILNIASAQPLWKNITAFHDILTSSQSELSEFLDASESVPNWSVINNDIKPYREYVVILPLIVLVTFGLMMILNHFCFAYDYLNNKSCCCCCSFSVIFCGLLLFILVCVQFAVSVLIADACYEPNDTLWEIVDTHLSKQDVTTQQMIKYYIYCADNKTIHNPLYTAFNASYHDLNALNQSLYRLVFSNISTKYGIVPEANALYDDYCLSLQLMDGINDNLQCDSIESYKENMTNELCIDGLQHWMIYYVLQYLCVLLIVIRSWCICTENKERQNAYDDEVQNGCKDYGTHNKTEMELQHTLNSSIADPLLIVRVPKSPSIEQNSASDSDILININSNEGRRRMQYRVDTKQTVYDLMEIIEMREGIDTAQQKLLFRGETLLPDSVIVNVLRNGDNIDLIIVDLDVSL